MGEKSLQGNSPTILNPYPLMYSATTHLSVTAQPVQYPNKKQNILDRECRSVDTHCFAVMIRTELLDSQTAMKHIYP